MTKNEDIDAWSVEDVPVGLSWGDFRTWHKNTALGGGLEALHERYREYKASGRQDIERPTTTDRYPDGADSVRVEDSAVDVPPDSGTVGNGAVDDDNASGGDIVEDKADSQGGEVRHERDIQVVFEPQPLHETQESEREKAQEAEDKDEKPAFTADNARKYGADVYQRIMKRVHSAIIRGVEARTNGEVTFSPEERRDMDEAGAILISKWDAWGWIGRLGDLLVYVAGWTALVLRYLGWKGSSKPQDDNVQESRQGEAEDDAQLQARIKAEDERYRRHLEQLGGQR